MEGKRREEGANLYQLQENQCYRKDMEMVEEIVASGAGRCVTGKWNGGADPARRWKRPIARKSNRRVRAASRASILAFQTSIMHGLPPLIVEVSKHPRHRTRITRSQISRLLGLPYTWIASTRLQKASPYVMLRWLGPFISNTQSRT